MARRITFFVGPYALFRVPADEWAYGWGRDEALYVEVLDGAALRWTEMDWGPVAEGGREFLRFYGFPAEARPGSPARPMLWEADTLSGELHPFPAPADWAGLDRRAEVRWLRSAFAAELGRAGELFGGRPTFRWGLVFDTVP